MNDDRKPGRLGEVPEPRASISEDDLPHALTFFLTAGQRRAVLAALSGLGRSRGESLLAALKIEHEKRGEHGRYL